MKCTFRIWEGYYGDGHNSTHIYSDITVYKPSFELTYEFSGYKFKFDHFLNTSYQHAYYEEA